MFWITKGVCIWCLMGLIGLSSVHAHHPKTKLSLEIASAPEKYQEFSAFNLDNQTLQLSDFQGKVIFLNFWATWCVPCREEMPVMKQLAERIQDERFVIVTVNQLETAAKIQKFYQELEIQFTTLLDLEGKIFELYRVNRLPTTYVINKQGFVVARAIGPRNWAKKDFVDYFQHLVLEEKPPQNKRSIFPFSFKEIFGQ